MTFDSITALQNLRTRAERRRLVTEGLPPGADADVQRLVQELQVHQIELEMQYEELLLAQTDAEASRAQYHDLYDFAPVGYCSLAPDGTLSQLNLRTSQLLGQVRQQLLGRRLALYVDLADRLKFSELLARLWREPGQRLTLELAMRRADDTPFVAQLEGQATADDPVTHAPATCRLVLLDITERRRAADTLAASEARFRATFEQSSDGMVLLKDHRFVDVNAAVLRLLGCHDRSEIVGHRFAGFWPERQPDGRRSLDLLTQGLAQAQAQGWGRLELQRADGQGQVVWDELSFNPVLVQGQPLMHADWRDITERRLAEQRLQQSEEHLHRALAATATGTWSYDLATRLLKPDARAQAIFGLPASEAPFAELLARVHPADLASVRQALVQARRARTAFELEHRLLLPDGSVRYVAASGQFSYDDATGEPYCLNGLVRDITSRRQGQLQLSSKTRLLDNILHHLPVLLGRVGLDHRFRELVGSGLRPLGLADDAVVGQLTTDQFPGDAAHIDALLAGQSESYVATLQVQGQPVYYQTYTFFDPERQEGVFFSLNITEAERLKEEAERQRQRQQQEVLAAVLTAQEEERRRIAESLHNGLGQLLYGTRLHLDLLPDSEGVRTVKTLLAEAIRTTRDLSFELTPGVLEEFGLPVALRELVKRIPPSQLRIDLNLSGLTEPLPAALQIASYRMVQELLNNVIKHAHAQEVFVEVSREDNTLYISVEDDGVGFDTSQPTLSPKGIGMAGIRTRVSMLSGTLTVQSRLAQGTRIFLVLPVES